MEADKWAFYSIDPGYASNKAISIQQMPLVQQQVTNKSLSAIKISGMVAHETLSRYELNTYRLFTPRRNDHGPKLFQHPATAFAVGRIR